ncbi:outer membrane beta-barrel family protein [Arcticibacter tournemirensis]|uniref:TonB-dependent receptor n=1 Tax=Arcticibacter tournemirensis TaxID=699437 RepID=A0A4Q0MB34_9SPHI|nr:outer membrane beta-barrel family protein [Arcticibacter tournemirensis]RXF70498.1 TonB-dependent receptor [Arcticibacter tournemirensis]
MRTILILIFCFVCTAAAAQTLTGTLTGRDTHIPVAYATVSLLDTLGKPLAGTMTDEKGGFLLKCTKQGTFTLICSSVGYQTLQRSVMLSGGKTDAGSLLLIPDTRQLAEVKVSGQQSALRLLPDKKVFEVGKDVFSQNGSISDALNGIPSVAVSPQGEVSLRGNAGVTVLVNGRRSGLTQGGALEQLQADQVERIEVITSPSARYDASGNAGIINIVLKKNKKAGFNGQIKMVAGVPNDTRINPSINYKSDKFNFFSTFGMRKSDYKGIYTSDQVTGTATMKMKQDEKRHDDGKMLYFGADYFISDKRTMTAAYLWHGTHDHDKTSLNYNYRNTAPAYDSILQRNGESWERRNYHQLEYNYTQLFPRARQKWTVDLQYDWWDSDKDWALATGKLYPAISDYPGIRTHTRDANRDLLVQSDWVQPLGKETMLELGIKSENRHVQYDFLAQQQADGIYVTYDGLDNGLDYNERIQGAYAQLGGKQGKLSYLGGLRLELTGIRSSGRNGAYTNNKDYIRLFPTMHLDYALSAASTVQAHYSCRISRPSLGQLSPYLELTDLNAQNTGNPDLNPAYSDLYELGFLFRNSKVTINPSLYFQYTDAPITNYTSRNHDGTFITLPVNIGKEIRQGFELNVMYNPLNALQINADFNLYHFRQSGAYKNFDFGFSDGSSSGRFSTQWKLSTSLSAQGRYYFNGLSATAQSHTRATHWADFGVSKNLLSDRLSLVADVTNVFDTRRYRTTTTGPDYVFSTMSRFNGARYRLSVVYKFKGNATVREAKSGNRSF